MNEQVDTVEEHTFEDSGSLDKTRSIHSQLSVLYNNMFKSAQHHSKLADVLLDESKKVALLYLENPRLIDKISTTQIANLYEFILLKLSELADLKSDLNLRNIPSTNFAELEIQMQKYKKHTLSYTYDEVLYNEIDHNITALYDNLIFSYSIFKHIVRDRNLFNG